MEAMGVHVEAMLALKRMGAITFDYGNNIRTQAKRAGVENAYDIPGFVPNIFVRSFAKARGRFDGLRFRAIPKTFASPTVWHSKFFRTTKR
jgi:urocanate hydratase